MNCSVDLFHKADTPVLIQVTKVDYLQVSNNRANDEVSPQSCSKIIHLDLLSSVNRMSPEAPQVKEQSINQYLKFTFNSMKYVHP